MSDFAAPGAQVPSDAPEVVRPLLEAAPSLGGGSDALAALREDVQARKAEIEPTKVFPVPGRERWAVRYATGFPHEELQAWKRAAIDKSASHGYDEFRLALAILGNTARAVLFDGEVARDADGAPLTLSSRALWADVLEAPTPSEGIRKLYGSDAAVLATSEAITEAAGYGQQVTAVDPTRR